MAFQCLLGQRHGFQYLIGTFIRSAPKKKKNMKKQNGMSNVSSDGPFCGLRPKTGPHYFANQPTSYRVFFPKSGAVGYNQLMCKQA